MRSMLDAYIITGEKPIDDDDHLPAVLNDWYETITVGRRFKKWYFGHMHVDQAIMPKLWTLHTDMRLIGDDKLTRWAWLKLQFFLDVKLM